MRLFELGVPMRFMDQDWVNMNMLPILVTLTEFYGTYESYIYIDTPGL